MSIVSEYPFWLIIFCIALGAIYASVLYTGKNSKKWHKNIRRLLFILRFIAVTLLAFMLLEPFFKVNTKIKQKPILAVVTDNSASMVATKDSVFIKNELPKKISSFTKSVSKDINVEHYNFGDSIRIGQNYNFDNKFTDLGNSFIDLKNRYISKNLIGIVLFSDGIYNTGINPMLAAEQIHVPVFSVALGDTNIYTDVSISSLTSNRETVFNNYFPIEFSISATEATNKNVQVNVFLNDKNIFSRDVLINEKSFSKIFNVNGFADKKGLNKIYVSVSSLQNEINKVNNSRTFYFNVNEDKKKILIVSNFPHPDVRALRQTLETNLNYDVKSVISESNSGDIADYDLIIAHQIPSINRGSSTLLEKAKSANTPVWIIAGNKTNFKVLNALNAGISVRVRDASENKITAIVNEKFELFNIPQNEIDFVKSMPPLNSVFGEFSTSFGANILLWQKIGSIVSSQPLLSISQVENQRWAFLLGDGIWRWRLYDYQRNKNFNLFNSFFSRIAQFLCQNSDRSRFRVIYEPTNYETENIKFSAELYNQNFELINSEIVELKLFSNSENYNFTFVPDGSGYSLNCGRLKSGEYNFTATVKSAKYPYSQSGKITIDDYNPEFAETKADFNLMNQIAIQTGGISVDIENLDEINKFLESKKLIQTSYIKEKKYIEIVDWKWILLIIILLVSIEWVVRKREGFY